MSGPRLPRSKGIIIASEPNHMRRTGTLGVGYKRLCPAAFAPVLHRWSKTQNTIQYQTTVGRLRKEKKLKIAL
jgi:hypothetical protein